MNKRRRNNNELNAGSAVVGDDSFDEDIDESSIMGCKARSSVPDADSTHGNGRGLLVNLMAGTGEEDACDAAVAKDDDDDDGTVQSRGGCDHHRRSVSTRRKFYYWWTNFASRVSRSASSLLNQHTPNLNDMLEATGAHPLEERRQSRERGVPRDGSTPENRIDDDDDDDDDGSGGDRVAFALREEIAMLKERIRALEYERDGAGQDQPPRRDVVVRDAPSTAGGIDDIPSVAPVRNLRPDHISRYSRQLLLGDGFGVAGQRRLLSTSVLVIGAGGIGSTVLLYLAAAGIGHVTVVDYDRVETSNLHRQVIHRDVDASGDIGREGGLNKAISARRAMLNLNPTMSCTALAIVISADNALELVSKHDVVVDASDNPQTRYLLNDACILAGKPLVSGSAMGTEGQLTVYNYQPADASLDGVTQRAACYRCLYPKPVAAEGCKSCSDNGVLGMVPGVVGILQAVEVIKVVTGIGSIMHDRLMMYDSMHCSFMNVKKPPVRPNCAVCSPDSAIKTMSDSARSLENVRGPSICALPTSGGMLASEQNVSCVEYNHLRKNGQPHVLLDVRVARQYEMCSLDGSINLPLELLESQLETVGLMSKGELPVFCICRRGIASAEATAIIQKSIEEGNAVHSVYNIAGGLNSWVETVDSEFPRY